MMLTRKILTVTEQSRFNEQNQLVRYHVVRFKVGDYGPFVVEAAIDADWQPLVETRALALERQLASYGP